VKGRNGEDVALDVLAPGGAAAPLAPAEFLELAGERVQSEHTRRAYRASFKDLVAFLEVPDEGVSGAHPMARSTEVANLLPPGESSAWEGQFEAVNQIARVYGYWSGGAAPPLLECALWRTTQWRSVTSAPRLASALFP